MGENTNTTQNKPQCFKHSYLKVSQQVQKSEQVLKGKKKIKKKFKFV